MVKGYITEMSHVRQNRYLNTLNQYRKVTPWLARFVPVNNKDGGGLQEIIMFCILRSMRLIQIEGVPIKVEQTAFLSYYNQLSI